VTQKIHGSAIEIRGPMSRDHVKELVMGSPHVEEFEVPPALDRMIQTNFGRRVVCKSFRRIKVKMSQREDQYGFVITLSSFLHTVPLVQL
jgi:hypothetical protein